MACVDAFPVDCIHPKKDTQYEDGRAGFEQVDQLLIDPVECIDCGACVPVCPVRRSSLWTIFPRSGSPTLRRTPSTSKEANSSRTNTGQRSCQPPHYDTPPADVECLIGARWGPSVAPSQLPQSIGLRLNSREPGEVNSGFDSGFTPGGYMFDSLADQIKHDEQEQINSTERFLRWVAIAVLSFVAFGGLYLGIHLLH